MKDVDYFMEQQDMKIEIVKDITKDKNEMSRVSKYLEKINKRRNPHVKRRI